MAQLYTQDEPTAYGQRPIWIMRETGGRILHGTNVAMWARDRNGTYRHHQRRWFLNRNIRWLRDQWGISSGIHPLSHSRDTIAGDNNAGILTTVTLLNFSPWGLEYLPSNTQQAIKADFEELAGKAALSLGIASWNPTCIQRIDDHVNPVFDVLGDSCEYEDYNEIAGWQRVDARELKKLGKTYGIALPSDEEILLNYNRLSERILQRAARKLKWTDHAHCYIDDYDGTRRTQWDWNWREGTKIVTEYGAGYGLPDRLDALRQVFIDKVRRGVTRMCHLGEISPTKRNLFDTAGATYNLYKPEYVQSMFSRTPIHDAAYFLHPGYGDLLDSLRAATS